MLGTGADVGEVDRPFFNSQPGAAQPLRSAAAAAEEEARRSIAARAQDPEYGATMIQAAFRGHAARRARSQRASDSARRSRTKVPAVFREVYSERGGRARILAVATLTDSAQVIGCPLANDMPPLMYDTRHGLRNRQHRGSMVGFMPAVHDSADYATATHVRGSGERGARRGRRPVTVPQKELVHQDHLAQVQSARARLSAFSSAQSFANCGSRGLVTVATRCHAYVCRVALWRQ